MLFTVIKINLLFSPRSFVDNDAGLLGRQYKHLVVVNHCLEFVDFQCPTETLVDTTLLMQLRLSYYASYYDDKGKEKNFLKSSFFDVIFRLEFNFDVISDKLERSPVLHLRIILRFTKEFH